MPRYETEDAASWIGACSTTALPRLPALRPKEQSARLPGTSADGIGAAETALAFPCAISYRRRRRRSSACLYHPWPRNRTPGCVGGRPSAEDVPHGLGVP